MPRRTHLRLRLLPLLAAAFLPLMVAAACSSKAQPSTMAPRASAAPVGTAPPSATTVAPVAASVAPALPPPAATTPAPLSPPPAPTSEPSAGQAAPPAPPAASVTPTPILITVPTPPPPDYAPCTNGQIKGNKSTMAYYLPGQIGYNDLKANVACFNTIDAATAAGYKLPGP